MIPRELSDLQASRATTGFLRCGPLGAASFGQHPQPDGFVSAAGQRQPAVRRESDAGNLALVLLEESKLLARRDVPKSDG